MKRTLLSFLLLSPLAATLNGCGGSTGTTGFYQATGGSGASQQAGPQPGASNTPVPALSGKVLIQPVAVVEEGDRSALVQFKTLIELEGVRVTADGAFVEYPKSPAAGWTAELGAQSVLINMDGSFAFNTPTDGATEGRIVHPSDPSMFFRFRASQLGQAEPLLIPVPFPASCGMQAADTETFCAPRTAAVAKKLPKEQTSARVEDVDPALVRPVPRIFHERRRLKPGPLGTEPEYVMKDGRVDLEALNRCPDVDGVLQFVIPGLDVLKMPRYIFSTCHDFVTTNACLNENAKSDRLALSDFEDRYLNGVTDLQTRTELILLRDPVTDPERNIHCYQNHKHRNCGQISIGDLACKLPDATVVRPSGLPLNPSGLPSDFSGPGFGLVEVGPGETKMLTLHNNGAFGITKIKKLVDGAKGNFSGPGVVVNGGIPEVRHYSPTKFVSTRQLNTSDDADEYIPDRGITYVAPGDARVGQVDTYLFIVDDRYIVISFKVVSRPPFLRRLGSNAELTVQDLNVAGTMTTLRGNKTNLEILGQDPIELLDEPGRALINDAGYCVYQADTHQSPARYRANDGTTVNLNTPARSLSNFSEGVLSLSPQGYYFCKAKRDDGKMDLYTFTGDATTAGRPRFLGVPELNLAGELVPLSSTTESALYANAPGGTATPPSIFAGIANAGTLATWNFDTAAWTTVVVPPRADFLPASAARYVDACANGVLKFTLCNNFSPAVPPADTSWFSFFNFLIFNGNPFVIERESEHLSASGSRTISNTTEPVPATGTYAVHTVTGLNDAGEVLGTVRDQNGSRNVLFSRTGVEQTLDSLLPAGAPAGSWGGLKIAGRYVVLQHSGDGEPDLYLWFRGTE